jgi:hypothetical protein
MSAVLAIAGTLQVGLTFFHIGTMPCPFVRLTGIPCPGCGVSRACAALLRGRWGLAMRYHAFAPFFFIAILLFTLAAVLPKHARRKLVAGVAIAEQKLAVVWSLLVLLLVYWLVRLVYAPDNFYNLVGGGS